MTSFKPVPTIYFILFILIINCVHFVMCLNMWTSLEQKQAENKTPVKKCVSPCRIFHSWCKNEGKCREKGRDCTWYCECPSNCEGFFCEKKLEKGAATNGGQNVEVKISYEKEKKKPVSAFDKSKLAQALAGIFLKEKQTDGEKKPVMPETIERVGKTINTKENVTATVIINCPPGYLSDKGTPVNQSTESTTQKTTLNVSSTQSIPKLSSSSVLEPPENSTVDNKQNATGNETQQLPSTVKSSSTQSAVTPLVPSSFTVTPRTFETTTTFFKKSTTSRPQDSNYSDLTDYKTFKTTTTQSLTPSTTSSATSSAGSSKLTTISLPTTTPNTTTRTTTTSSSSSSSTTTKTTTTTTTVTLSQASSAPTEKNIATLSSSATTIPTPKSSPSSSTTTTKTTTTELFKILTNPTERKITSTSSILTSTATAKPKNTKTNENQSPKSENSLYAKEPNDIKVSEKPSLLKIIEKAIEVELITTTTQNPTSPVKTTTENIKGDKTKAVTTEALMNDNNAQKNNQLKNVMTTVATRNILSNHTKQDIDKIAKNKSIVTVKEKIQTSTSKPKLNGTTQVNSMSTDGENLTKKVDQVLSTHASNITEETNKQPMTDKPNLTKSSDVNVKSNTHYATDILLSKKNTSDEIIKNTKSGDIEATGKIIKIALNKTDSESTTPKVERPTFERTTSRTNSATTTPTRSKIEFETTTIKATTSATVNTAQTHKTTDISKSEILKISNSDSYLSKQSVSEDSPDINKSTSDTVVTGDINTLSSANVPPVYLSQAITMSHDLSKNRKIDERTEQTVLNKITQKQLSSITSNTSQSVTDSSSTQSTKQRMLESSPSIVNEISTTEPTSLKTEPAAKKEKNAQATNTVQTDKSMLINTQNLKQNNNNTTSKETEVNDITPGRIEKIQSNKHSSNNSETKFKQNVIETVEKKSSNEMQDSTPQTQETTTKQAPSTTSLPVAESTTSNIETTSSVTSIKKGSAISDTDYNSSKKSGLKLTEPSVTKALTTYSTLVNTTDNDQAQIVSSSVPDDTGQLAVKNDSDVASVIKLAPATETRLIKDVPIAGSITYSTATGTSGKGVSLTKAFLEKQSDLLRKSKVRNELLSNTLTETAKDSNFETQLRDRGLPSDLDNIL